MFSFQKKSSSSKKLSSDAYAPYGKKLIFTNGLGDNSVSIGDGAVFRGTNNIDFWRESAKNTINIGEKFNCHDVKIVFKGSNNTLIIGDDVSWTGHILIVGNNRTVTIGNATTAKGVYILSRGADVTIGEQCLFSREIEIRTTDVHKIYCLDTDKHLNPASPITIENEVWIGARAMISKGVSIAKGSIIGAGSFVNKAFPDNHVVIAGSPAKIVKRNIRWVR